MAKLPSSEPTFWPVNGQAWIARTAAESDMSISGESGLRLAAEIRGPLGLTWPDGSIGGLALPLGMAIDADNRLYLLDLGPPWKIRVYNHAKAEFRALPGVGGRGSSPRLFDRPANIALLGSNLYVVDRGNSRVQVFDRRTLALNQVWDGSFGAPLDIAAGPHSAWLLNAEGQVYRHHPGTNSLVFAFQLPDDPDHYRRILVDLDERIYILREEGETAVLQVYDQSGQLLEIAADAGYVRARFRSPALRLFFDRRNSTNGPDPQRGYFCLPQEMTSVCDPQLPNQPPDPERPLDLCLPVGGSVAQDAQIFDRHGRPVKLDPADLIETPIYKRRGYWISKALDSDRYRCQWHRVELEMDRLAPGTRVTISTLSADEVSGTPVEGDGRWIEGYRVAGTLEKPGVQSAQPDDFLVQSRPGQFLWLKIVFESDGFSSPALRKVRVHFPRQSYLEYLPAIFSEEKESRWFLERFLSIFKTDWDQLEEQIANLPALFDPDAVPGGPFLRQLARWIALPLEGTWDSEQQRNLLRQVSNFYPQRGTAAGLHIFLQVYLQNLTGLSPEEQGDFPVIVEGFRRRNHTLLSAAGAEGMGSTGYQLWSPSVVNRLQTDSHARAGEVQLVSTKDPARDMFHQYAHRFQVYLPAAWVRCTTDERMVRRALEAEKPAHTSYELCLVPARFRVGVQSTVGLDTIVGGIPQTRLICQAELSERAAGHPAGPRLGYDTILAGRAEMMNKLPFQSARL